MVHDLTHLSSNISAKYIYSTRIEGSVDMNVPNRSLAPVCCGQATTRVMHGQCKHMVKRERENKNSMTCNVYAVDIFTSAFDRNDSLERKETKKELESHGHRRQA